MDYRKAQKTDIQEIKSLWEAVFFDSEEFISCFLSHFGIENCYVCEVNGGIAAMAFALPTTLSVSSKFKVQSLKFKVFNLSISNRKSQIVNLKSHYIYGCATHPKYRRQGVMEKLLAIIYEEACNDNVTGVFLHAANQNSSSYYKKLGFEDFFYRGHTEVFFNRKEHKGYTKGAMNPITPEKYYEKRVQKLEKKCFVNWDKDFFKFLHQTGMQFSEYENTIFAFKTENGIITVDELLGKTQTLQISNMLFEYYPDYNTVQIRTIGQKNCYGQIKWCRNFEDNLNNGYFAFAIE